MSHRIFLLVLSLLAAVPASGQEFPPALVGLHVGAVHSSVASDEISDDVVEARINPSAGISLDTDLSEHVGLRIGVGYALKSFALQIPVEGPEALPMPLDLHLRFEYMEAQALLRLGVRNGLSSFHALVGPVLGLNLSCEMSAMLAQASIEQACGQVDLSPERLALGAAGGIGFAVEMGAGKVLLVDMLYTHGLLSFAGDGPDAAFHRSFAGVVGFAFAL